MRAPTAAQVVDTADRGWGAVRYARAMGEEQSNITAGLESVRVLREQRSADPNLDGRVTEIKRYQHRRFESDYTELLNSARYGAAARFFLNDLYGPVDFSARDAQFSRIVPALRRLLPDELVRTVGQLIELHALTESLDQAMALCVAPGPVDAATYANAWRQVGRRAERMRQVELMLDVGRALDRHTRKPLLGTTLRLMHAPAHAAGLGDLQAFLQDGFTAFKAMKGADEFLSRIAENERRQIAELFGPS